MAVQLPCTFLINGDRYDLIGMAGGNILNLDQFPTPPRELHTARHATYEIILDSLYLLGLTLKEENVHYLPVGRARQREGLSPIMYQGLSMMVPFTGKIRLARNFINQPYINMNYQKAIAFEFVLDIALRDGQVAEMKNRSLEMGQKRAVLKRHHESAAKLKNMGFQKALSVTTDLSSANRNRQIVHIKDRWEGMDQAGCALREYHESATILRKVLYAYGLDLDLE